VDPYLAERIKQVFATDPRLNELELDVEFDGSCVTVTGHVQTQERRAAITEIVRELLPDVTVRNRVRVPRLKAHAPVDRVP